MTQFQFRVAHYLKVIILLVPALTSPKFVHLIECEVNKGTISGDRFLSNEVSNDVIAVTVEAGSRRAK